MELSTIEALLAIGTGVAGAVGGCVKAWQWLSSRWDHRFLGKMTDRQRSVLKHFDQLRNVAGGTPTGGYHTIYWGNPTRPDNAANIAATMKELKGLGLLTAEGSRCALSKRGVRLKELIK